MSGKDWKSEIATDKETDRKNRDREGQKEKMVVISLYRGNMHRVPPDVTRRWLMPKPQISLKDFRTLLFRRSKALSLLPSATPSSSSAAAAVLNGIAIPFSPPPPPQLQPAPALENPNSLPEPSIAAVPVEVKVEDAAICDVNPPLLLDQAAEEKADETVQVAEEKEKESEKEKEKEKENEDEKEGEKALAVGNPASEGCEKPDQPDDEKQKRKRVVEEKLQILNEKKHNLVKALKQILNAEEELKRQTTMQAGRPPIPLQPDASNDSGSMTRDATPRAGSEANVVDMEGGEGDYALNQNAKGRQLLRVNSTSPSAESAMRRPPYVQHNVGSLPSRGAMVVTGSPSRFAPSGNQGHPSNFPTVSVTGTNYVASSPSPAASGGTSGFRDARQPSPWN